MPTTQTLTQEYLAWDHPFRAEWVALLGIGCIVILIWTLLRERAVLGVKTTWLFTALRTTALVAAFWMLLAPTSVVEKSTTTRKVVVMFTDTSASMTTVDPVGTADDARWSRFAEERSNSHVEETPLELADRSIAALGISHRELTAAQDALQQHGAESLVADHLQLASTAVARAQSHLTSLDTATSEERAGEGEVRIAPLLERLRTLLISPEFDSLAGLADHLRQGRTPSDGGWRDALPDWIGRVATTQRVFHELADQMSRRDPADVATGLENQSRSQRVAAFLRHFAQSSAAREISEIAQLRWSLFDQSARDLHDAQSALPILQSLAEHPSLAPSTNLSAALQHVEQLQRDQPVAATFVLSDVAHNDASERKPTDVLTQLHSLPIYVVPIGNDLRLRDIDLISVSAPTVAMRNDDVVIEAHLGIYQCAGERCTVQLLRGGSVVDFRNVPIESNAETRSVQFTQRVAEIGTADFQIAVQPLTGEMTGENNFDEIQIQVTRSDIKVLLADDLPRWEYRYLAQLFRRDPKVELDELLFHPRMIAPGQRQATQTFPTTVDQWDYYDVVILGDVPLDHLPTAAQESLLQYLRSRSGTLIMIAGTRAMPHAFIDQPLASIVPVQPIDPASDAPEGPYAFQVTEAGQSHAALMIGETEQATREAWNFVNLFSPIDQVSSWRTPLPTARSLIAVVPRHQTLDPSDPRVTGSSFLCWQPVGRGRIIYLASPDTYRLRFLRGDRLHYRFWGQLMRWAIAADLAAGNALVKIRTVSSSYATDQVIDVEVALLDSSGEPVIRDTITSDELHLRVSVGEQLRTLPLRPDSDRPGYYRAEIRDLPPGVYQAQPAGSLIDHLQNLEATTEGIESEKAVATFTVQADLPDELVDTRTNRVLAQQVAQATGGQVLPPTAVDEILALTNLDPVVTHSVQREPLWSRWRYLWLVFGCLQTEWIIRKWRGLS